MIELKAIVVGNGYTQGNQHYYLCHLQRNKTTQELEWVYRGAFNTENDIWETQKEAEDAAAELGAFMICEPTSDFYSRGYCRTLPFKESHLTG